jgi:hypothetical protein
MSIGEPTMPTDSTTEKQSIKSIETDVDLRDIMGRPGIEDDSLNKLEDEKMLEKEKLTSGWIEGNGIKKDTRLDYNGMSAHVSEIDFSSKTISLKFEEPFQDHDRDYSFEDIGDHIDFIEKLVKVKKSEED